MANLNNGIGTSHNLVNYSGMLFNRGNVRTPFATAIGGKSRTSNSFRFVLSQHYTTGGGTAQPAITEEQSLTAPAPTFVTRQQTSNVCQIFQGRVRITYAKTSDMGQLSGLNLEGQSANPADEKDFQIANKMAEMNNDIEYTFINGQFQDGIDDQTAYKTRGMLQAIVSNAMAVEDTPGLGYWLVAEMIEKIDSNHGDPTHLLMFMKPVHIMQLNADASANGLTVIPNSREVNGIRISELVTPFGNIGLLPDIYVPAGTVLFANTSICAPVHLPVPGKGNFFEEPLGKTGASEDVQIYGQLGLDYGAEWFHGKITGLATTFTAPEYSRKVFVVNGQ